MEGIIFAALIFSVNYTYFFRLLSQVYKCKGVQPKLVILLLVMRAYASQYKKVHSNKGVFNKCTSKHHCNFKEIWTVSFEDHSVYYISTHWDWENSNKLTSLMQCYVIYLPVKCYCIILRPIKLSVCGYSYTPLIITIITIRFLLRQ